MVVLSYPASASQALADTVVTVQARGGLEVASDVALLVLSLALLTTFIALTLFLHRLARLERTLMGAAREAMGRAGPLVERSRDVADNVEFITRALRTDVERLNASVKALTDRLGQASERMEERIEEFNALMELVQSEAEAIFIDTASTVRGVRAGARSLGDGEPHSQQEEPDADRRKSGDGRRGSDRDDRRDRDVLPGVRQEADRAPS